MQNLFYRLLYLPVTCAVCACLCHILAGCTQVGIPYSGNAKNMNSHNINHQKKQSFHKVSHAQIHAFEEAEKELRIDGIAFTNQLPKGGTQGRCQGVRH